MESLKAKYKVVLCGHEKCCQENLLYFIHTSMSFFLSLVPLLDSCNLTDIVPIAWTASQFVLS